MAPFPFPQLNELREKYTYNITPFTAAMSTGRKPRAMGSIFSDDDDFDDDEVIDNINCFTGIFPPTGLTSPVKSIKHSGELLSDSPFFKCDAIFSPSWFLLFH